MTLDEMTKVANSYTDENLRASQTLFYVNEAIGVVNAEVGTELPFVDEVDADYVALSETWIRQVIIPYMCYSIKMTDSAIQEAMIYKNGFDEGLQRLKSKKDNAIGVEYQGEDFSRTYDIDFGDMAGTYNIPFERYSVALWDEHKRYFKGEFVSYDNIIYQALRNHIGIQPPNDDYWRQVG